MKHLSFYARIGKHVFRCVTYRKEGEEVKRTYIATQNQKVVFLLSHLWPACVSFAVNLFGELEEKKKKKETLKTIMNCGEISSLHHFFIIILKGIFSSYHVSVCWISIPLISVWHIAFVTFQCHSVVSRGRCCCYSFCCWQLTPNQMNSITETKYVLLLTNSKHQTT